MSQSTRDTRDPEKEDNADGDQTSKAESRLGDNSGPFFSICSKAAEEEDNEIVGRWQQDAKGILIFTGLFSAAVSVFLSLAIPDLRQNSQDTSNFYLGNIYEVLADPNATRASIPSPVAKPPPFSPPRHAVWVNALWSLSLVMSVSCALLATSLQQWARRYIHLTQPSRRNPEMRARMRGFFKNGVDEMWIWLAVEGLPTLLHLSLFLFFGGLGIFLFNIDPNVFYWVVGWIGIFSIVYGLITLLPLIRQDSPYFTPLSKPAWFLRASIQCAWFALLAVFADCVSIQAWVRFGGLRDRYFKRMKKGMEKRAEEMASERSSEIDVHILDWTINALGDDDSLERFFESIPGFFNSEPERGLERHFPEPLLETFWGALDGFMSRTSSSHSVTESIKSRRDTICGDIMSMMPCSEPNMTDNLRSQLDQAPASIERSQAMARWIHHRSHDVSFPVRLRFAKIFSGMRVLDDRWIALADEVYGLPDPHEVALSKNNAILSILIHVCGQVKHSDELKLVEVFTEALAQFDIRDTLPELQHNFCTLWNNLVREAKPFNTPVNILRLIRHLYNNLHRGTDDHPIPIPSSSGTRDPTLFYPRSYQSCPNVGYRHTVPPPSQPPSRDSSVATPHDSSTPSGNTDLKPKATTNAEPRSPSDPTTDASPPGPGSAEAAMPQDFSALSSNTPSPPTDNATFPLPLAHGLENPEGNKCSLNAVLQLLVHCLPFWTLFRELGDSKGQRGEGGPETSGSATPLVDATVRFCAEFMSKGKGRPPLQQEARGKSEEDEEAKKKHDATGSFKPTYMNDAMKEKKQLRNLLDSPQQDAEEFFCLYLDALDEELLAPSTRGHRSATAAPGVEEHEVTHSGENDVGKRGFTAESVGSKCPLGMKGIFGGKFRSIVRESNLPETFTTEDWLSLQLDIQDESVNTIEDALARISHPQLVERGPSDSASQQVLIEALPHVLVLQLQRSLYDANAVKISKPVKFGPVLKIQPEIMAPVAGKSLESVDSLDYKLCGVLYHHGKSARSGHYAVDVLHPDRDSGGESWLHIDDEVVSPVLHDDVFGGHNDERGDLRCAYMLFYYRDTQT